MPVLHAILASIQQGLPALRLRRGELERQAGRSSQAVPFAAALRGDRVSVIAEVKRRSPSLGVINTTLDPAQLAGLYQRGGAAAVSVLTNGQFFGGSVVDLEAVTAAVALPVLRKDFIVDEVQLLEARAAGASAALLIVRIVDPARLGALLRFAGSIGLEALVEVHGDDELWSALDAGATIVGVNARDLDTLAIDAARAAKLLSSVPPTLVAVAESGMQTVDDVTRAADAGADAVLIGSALSGSPDPLVQLAALTTVTRRGR